MGSDWIPLLKLPRYSEQHFICIKTQSNNVDIAFLYLLTFLLRQIVQKIKSDLHNILHSHRLRVKSLH